MGRHPKPTTNRLEKLENALSSQGTAKVLLGMVYHRVQQAIDRKPELTNLLTPALDDISNIRLSLQHSQNELSELTNEDYLRNWTRSVETSELSPSSEGRQGRKE